MVYGHLVGGHTVFVAPPCRHPDRRTILPGDARDVTLHSLGVPSYGLGKGVLPFKHIFRPVFVGLFTLNELEEVWYRLSTFIVD